MRSVHPAGGMGACWVPVRVPARGLHSAHQPNPIPTPIHTQTMITCRCRRSALLLTRWVLVLVLHLCSRLPPTPSCRGGRSSRSLERLRWLGGSRFVDAGRTHARSPSHPSLSLPPTATLRGAPPTTRPPHPSTPLLAPPPHPSRRSTWHLARWTVSMPAPTFGRAVPPAAPERAVQPTPARTGWTPLRPEGAGSRGRLTRRRQPGRQLEADLATGCQPAPVQPGVARPGSAGWLDAVAPGGRCCQPACLPPGLAWLACTGLAASLVQGRLLRHAPLPMHICSTNPFPNSFLDCSRCTSSDQMGRPPPWPRSLAPHTRPHPRMPPHCTSAASSSETALHPMPSPTL